MTTSTERPGTLPVQELERVIGPLLRGESQSVELTEGQPDGSVRNVHFHAVPVCGPDGVGG